MRSRFIIMYRVLTSPYKCNTDSISCFWFCGCGWWSVPRFVNVIKMYPWVMEWHDFGIIKFSSLYCTWGIRQTYHNGVVKDSYVNRSCVTRSFVPDSADVRCVLADELCTPFSIWVPPTDANQTIFHIYWDWCNVQVICDLYVLIIITAHVIKRQGYPLLLVDWFGHCYE